MKSLYEVKAFLDARKQDVTDSLRNLSLSALRYQDFCDACIAAIEADDRLLMSETKSLQGALLYCAELGLMPGKHDNLAVLRPYWRNVKDDITGVWTKVQEARVLVGYQGWLEILIRNPTVLQIQAEIALESDEFLEVKGLQPNIIHTPDPKRTNPKRKAAYAVAYLERAPFPAFTVLYRNEIDQIKAISKSADADNYLWEHEEKDPMGWMWKKTAIKQLAKMLPKNKSMLDLLRQDNLVDIGAGTVYLTKDNKLQFVASDQAKANQRADVRKDKSQKVVDRLLSRRKKV